MLLCGISIRLLQKIYYYIFCIFAKIDNSVVSNMFQITFIQFSTQNFHICIGKIIDIICFLTDCFVIGINHGHCRLKYACALFILHIFTGWYSIKAMYLFLFLPDKLPFLGKPPNLGFIRYTSMQYIIGIHIQSNKIPFPAQHRIIIDHKCIKWSQVGNPDVPQFIHIIHLISFAIDTTDFRQLCVIIILIVILVQKLHIVFNVIRSIIIYRNLNRISDKKSIECVHHILCKVNRNTVIRFIIRLWLLVENLVISFICIFQMFKPKGTFCIMLCYKFVQFMIRQFFF